MRSKPPPTAAELKLRLILMLAALERAGVSPVEINQLHAFAFFANVLSPLWNLDPLQGSVLKRKDGPYYRELQYALDELIGTGAVDVIALDYRIVEDGARLAATVRIALQRVDSVLTVVKCMPDEMATAEFLGELAFIFAEIEPARAEDAVGADATYNAPSAATDRVVDFAEYRTPREADYSVRAAQRLQAYAPEGVTLNQAEELVLYMRLMKRKAYAIGA
jgi:hypothetical protein